MSQRDRVIVVTGAFGALGSAVASAFVDQHARVVLVDVMPRPSALIAEQFGAPHLILGGIDLTSLQSAAAAMDRARAELGRIDVLVNVAGAFRWQRLIEGDLASWDFMYSVNLKTAVTAARAALPHMLASSAAGRIINVGAGAAIKAAAGMGAYAASKAGVQRLTESLAEELKGRGITVNAVLPGTIDTAQNRADMPNADRSEWVAPAAIAEVIVFLASHAARAITGASIPVLGGA